MSLEQHVRFQRLAYWFDAEDFIYYSIYAIYRLRSSCLPCILKAVCLSQCQCVAARDLVEVECAVWLHGPKVYIQMFLGMLFPHILIGL